MAKTAGNGDLDIGPVENIEMTEGEPRIRPQPPSFAYSPPPWSRQSSHTQSSKRQRPPLARSISIKNAARSMKESVADFFGVGEENPDEQEKWLKRCMSLANNNAFGGKLKPGLEQTGTMESVFDSAPQTPTPTAPTPRLAPMPYDPLKRPNRQDSRSSKGSYYPSRHWSRQISTASSGRRSMKQRPTPRLTRKDSVIMMAVSGVKQVARAASQRSSKRKPYLHSRSFTPSSVSSYPEEYADTLLKTPTVDSVFSSLDDEGIDADFFDLASATSPLAGGMGLGRPAWQREISTAPATTNYVPALFPTATPVEPIPEATEDLSPASGDMVPPLPPRYPESSQQKADVPPVLPPRLRPIPEGKRPSKSGWQIGRFQPEPKPDTPDLDLPDGSVGMKRIMHNVVDQALLQSTKREVGKGLVGQWMKQSYIAERIDSDIKAQIDDIDDHRPFFTYWVTFVQIVIYVIAVLVHGIAPVGFEETEVTSEVITSSLSTDKVSYFEKDNFWIGPTQAKLIHLGAKYSPCMRNDENVRKAIEKDMKEEKKSACCVNNDGSGCVQANIGKCPPTLSTWFKWNDEMPGPSGRMSGSVCGQDPRYCKSPAFTGAFEWKDDISKWPICKDSAQAPRSSETLHMTCEVVGRPCCIGVHGQCIITTREYCEFRQGYFHEEASLCSQISCMDEICGMIPFVHPGSPNQFYRLWTSLFMHAGILQLTVTVLFQYFIMRDLEKLAGWLRIAIIYLGSGIAGSLSSAIFLPYHVEAGPSGSQFGLLACLFVEVIQNWYILAHPWWALIKLSTVLVLLFILGLLPMIDNYAHLVGFIVGILLAFAMLPYVTFGKFDRVRKLVGIVICLLSAMGLFAGLIILFYVSPVYNCEYCRYFNCIPFTEKFCKSSEAKIVHEEF